MTICDEIRERLQSMSEPAYREFQASLVPDTSNVLGVRTPLLRAYAGELSKRKDIDAFFRDLPHRYYEENNLHAFLIEKEKDFDACVRKLNAFLPFVDNWATCDCMNPKVLARDPDRLDALCRAWMGEKHPFTVRFGIGMRMRYFLGDAFSQTVLQEVAELSFDHYYVNMMRAWFFATALAKQYDETLLLLKEQILPAWVQNNTIQKARESFRLTTEQKEMLKDLKIK